MLRRLATLAILPVLAVTVLALTSLIQPVPAAEATPGCPKGSGEVWNGPVEIDRTCIVWGVTIRGDVTIQNNGRLILVNSTVLGNINVVNGGQLDTDGMGVAVRTVNNLVGSQILCSSSVGAAFLVNTCR